MNTKKNKIKKLGALVFLFALLSTQNIFAKTDKYTVKYGDTLWKIAKKYQVGVSEIINANDQFRNPDMIYPGDKVTIPLVDESVKTLEQEVLNLVNKERKKNNLPELKLDWEISRVARYKSQDMCEKNYFSHTSPTYGSPFDMLKKFKISYVTAGENIAKGQKTAQAVMNSWMNSQRHRANILNKNFTKMGVGMYEKNNSIYWTQLFVK